jgi:pimeloyl-ACP methyl ester carboxylesterase
MTTLTSADGTAIAFDRTGDGPSVILVAGALGNRFSDAQLAELLAPEFAVFTYDRRGRGDSGDGAAYAVEREIEDLEALIEQAGGSACVYGTSSGGNLALEAATRGASIGKLALWEPNFLVDDSRPPLPDDYVEHLDELVAAGRRGDAVEYFMTTAVGMPAEFVAPMRELPMWPGMEQAAHTLAYDGTVVAGFALDAALPQAQHRTLDGQPHNVAADAVAPALREFLAGVAEDSDPGPRRRTGAVDEQRRTRGRGGAAA